MRRPFHRPILAAALLLSAFATPLRAEMTDPDRAAFGEEVRAYLLANPEILTEMFALLETRQMAATEAQDRERIAANAAAIFDDGYSYVGGNPTGSVTMVEFVDYQCGYCRRAHPDVMELVSSDGDIRRIIKDYPILGPGSELAARAAISTMIVEGSDAYARLNENLMELSGPVTEASLDAVLTESDLDPATIRAGMTATEVTRRLEANLALARSLDIQGTPSFVFDDQMLRGYVPLAGLRNLVAGIRAAN